MENFKGWKTVLVSIIQTVFGVLTMAGYTFPEGMDQAVIDNLSMTIGGAITVFGLVFGYLRTVTDTPVGKSQ